MKLIRSLWQGKFTPQSNCGLGREAAELAGTLEAAREALLTALGREARACFDEYESASAELASASEEKIFAEGFRAGAQMMLEIITDPGAQRKEPT